MALIWQRYNTNAGWAIEKGFNDFARQKLGIKGFYRVDYSMIMKLVGILPPKDKIDFDKKALDIAKKISNRTKVGTTQDVLLQMTQFYNDLWRAFKE